MSNTAPALSAPTFSAAVSSAAVAASDKELRRACCASLTFGALERGDWLQLGEVDARALRTAKALSLRVERRRCESICVLA